MAKRMSLAMKALDAKHTDEDEYALSWTVSPLSGYTGEAIAHLTPGQAIRLLRDLATEMALSVDSTSASNELHNIAVRASLLAELPHNNLNGMR